MQTGKNKTSTKADHVTMKVVVVDADQASIEREIERHIHKIRSLITRLHPSERRKYFNGLLSHILDEQPDASHSMPTHKKSHSDTDYSKLSSEELKLIEELSVKMEQLYRTMNLDPS